MANWKKMAEAFGRALSDPSVSREGRRLIKAGKRDLTDQRLKTTDNGLRLEPSNPGYDRDATEAYTRGQMGGIKDDTENIQKGYGREERSQLFDERTDQRTDEALEGEFDKEFNDAIERRKQGVKDRYGKDYPQDMAEEGAEAFEKDLWNVIDELRAKGMSGNDILDILKGK